MKYGKFVKQPDDLTNPPTGKWSKIYEWFWSRLGGKPFTYRIRDAWYTYPLVWILCSICLWIVMVFLGVVLGHLFWSEG